MSVSLPVIIGAGVVIVALLCIGVTARRRRAGATELPAEPVEAVFVDDMPGELASFVPSVEPHSEPAAAHAHVYPVHKLQQAVAETPITFGPGRRAPEGDPIVEADAPLVVREPQLQPAPLLPVESQAPETVAPKLEVVPDPEPERDVAPAIAPEAEIEPELLVEEEPAVEAAPVIEPVPTPEVALLTAQIEVLAETIARLTDRLDAVASAVTISPVPADATAARQAVEPELEAEPEPDVEPEPVGLRSVAYPPDVELALASEFEGVEPDGEADVEPEIVSVIEPEPEPVRPQPVARADRMARPPTVSRPDAEPTTYARKRVDDDLLAWPSDEDLDRFSGRQARRDI